MIPMEARVDVPVTHDDVQVAAKPRRRESSVPEFEDLRHMSAELVRKIAGLLWPAAERHRYTSLHFSLDNIIGKPS